jgi:hypothetical protein
MRFSAGISTPSSLGINVYVDLSVAGLSLPLFVPGILADDADNVLALHDLARFTKSFY